MAVDRRLQQDLKKLAKEPPAAEAFGAAAHELVARALPYDFGLWFAIDPTTLLPTRLVPAGHDDAAAPSPSLLEIMKREFAFHDSFSVGALARTPGRVTTLLQITAGDPTRSERYATQADPPAVADELRMVLTDSGEAWGMMWLYRRTQEFNKREIAVARDLGAKLGAGLRRCVLQQEKQRESQGAAPTGLIFLDEDGAIARISKHAQRLLGADPEEADWLAVFRAAFDKEESASIVVEAAGGPVALHCSGDPEELVIIVERPRPVDNADRLVRVYGLTPRERDVLAAVSRGLSTRLIAYELDLADYTVQDHLRSIFSKLGVRGRNEIMAKLFFEQYTPGHRTESLPEPGGWTLPDKDDESAS